jgi:hypothetical protein
MYTITLQTNSKRGEDWVKFAQLVLKHVDEYTVPQYGDEGTDIATDYSPEDALRSASKYVARYGKNIREGEQLRDFVKIAHYAQIAYKQWNRKA